jgi:DNA-directed RNA polymerase specialized sigma24 family protein
MNVTDEQLEITNNVADMLATYFTFGYYEIDDIKQEIKLMCLDALSRFDETKGASLRTFLIVHAKNRLITLKRDKLCRIYPPCYSCKDWNNESCQRYDLQTQCIHYVKWNRVTTDKHNLFALSELSENDISYETDILEDIHKQNLFAYIDENIPAKYRADYLSYIENGKMTTYAKKRIKQIIKELAEDYLN